MEAAVTEIEIQKYEAYRESGVEWLGEVPAHWEVVRSKALFQERKEKARKDDKQLTASQKYGMIGQEEFMEREGRRVTVVFLDRGILKHIEANDFVISMRSFQGGLEHSNLSGCVSSAYIPLIPIKHVVPAYFKYLFKSDGYIKTLSSTSNLVRDGQAMRFENFAAVTLLIVPEEEQTAIADFLDRKTAQIDKAIAQKERLIELLQERRQILIQRAVTRGLNPNAPMKDSGVEWIGEVPAHWEITQIKKVAKTLSGGTPPSGDREKYYGGRIPWIRTTDLNDSDLNSVPEAITQAAIRDTSCKEIQKEFVCVAMYGGAGTIGKHSLVRFSSSVNQAVCAVIPSDKIFIDFMFFYIKFCRPYWMIVAKGSRVDPNIGQDDIKNFPIVFPSLSEQKEVVTFLKSLALKNNQSIGKIGGEIQKLREYKSTLINAAVTGKIKVC